MEDSTSSTNALPAVDNDSGGDDDHSPEESGWTTYLEDFSQYSYEGGSFGSSFLGTSSIVSDAASNTAERRLTGRNGVVAVRVNSSLAPPPMPKQLSMIKRTRTKEITDEDPLEDTATSPVNSPKINHLKRMETMGTGMIDDSLELSLGNVGASQSCMEMKVSESKNENLTSIDGQNRGCSRLRKRGLCLVPLSMIMNYQFG